MKPKSVEWERESEWKYYARTAYAPWYEYIQRDAHAFVPTASDWIKIPDYSVFTIDAPFYQNIQFIEAHSVQARTRTHKAYDRWWTPVYVDVGAKDVVVIITRKSHSDYVYGLRSMLYWIA